jgi:hypothetical protein
LENIAKLKSLLRGIYHKAMPVACPKYAFVLCTTKDNGWCVFDRELPPSLQRCSCNPEWYGEACQYRKCPGYANTLYAHNAAGVCSERGSCNNLDGKCKCHKEYYHGPKNACEYQHAPKSKNGDIDNKCTNGRGVLDRKRGTCKCGFKYFGPGCEQKRCPNSNGVLYPAVSGNACDGHGTCNTHTGTCDCKYPYWNGDKKSCERDDCYQNCMGRGTCDTSKTGQGQGGKCNCRGTFFGPFCQFTACPSMMKGTCSGHGQCERKTGSCLCKMGFSGPLCNKTYRCKLPNLFNDKMNWWTVWDTPGWMLCPKGQLLYKLNRSKCSSLPDPKNDPMRKASSGGALSCIESGGCAAACEEGTPKDYIFQLRHCYHSLKWYNEFDWKGWTRCQDDYFIAGLYRSCDSLYCLNIVKCCSLKGSQPEGSKIPLAYGSTNQARWYGCGQTQWEFYGNSTARQVPICKATSRHGHLSPVSSVARHDLAGIKAASYCGWVRGY